MILHTLPNGDPVYRFDRTIVIEFGGPRKVLSTAQRNGGYQEHLKAVYNNDGNYGLGVPSKMKGSTMLEHETAVTQEIGLDIASTAGMCTAAHMENVAICEEKYEDLTVTAIVTGGIEVNGGRVGDPGFFVEKAEKPAEHTPGTINIFLHIDANLSPGCMTRALVTCTEAKTAALQELLAPSRYSRGLATGSGTDSTILIADAESRRYLTNAGKHSKLGELIGKAVKSAVKKALFLQTGLGPEQQHDAVARFSRFGVSEAGLYRQYVLQSGEHHLSRPKFANALEEVTKSGDGVAIASLLAHLMDQLDWGLLNRQEATDAAQLLLNSFAAKQALEFTWVKKEDPDAAEEILNNWSALIISQAVQKAGDQAAIRDT